MVWRSRFGKGKNSLKNFFMFKFEKNLIIGHRGCDSAKFENTIEAFLKAIELGAEMIEFDIRKTRDGVLIIHHDAEVSGMRIRGNLWGDVKKTAARKGLNIPTLEEALKTLEGKVKLDIELKEKGYEKEVLNLVLKYFTPAEFIVKSFFDESVLAIKKGFPGVTAGLLLGLSRAAEVEGENSGQRKKRAKIFRRSFGYLYKRFSEFFPWARVQACQADFIAPNWRLLIFGLAKSAAKKKVPVLVWTVDDEKKTTFLLKSMLFDGIITNKPEMVKKLTGDKDGALI